jgi:hypothetical protein
MSVVAGVVLVGLQFVLTAQLPPLAPIHVYVVWALITPTIKNVMTRRASFFIQIFKRVLILI